MARAGAGKQQVDLQDADEVGATAPRPRRRLRWWWALVPLVLVATLVGVQSVADERYRAAQDRLGGLPGVVRPVSPTIGVRWAPEDGSGGRFFTGAQVGSAVVAVEHVQDGSHRLVALDELTGARRWSIPVLDANPGRRPTLRGVPLGGCQGVRGAAERDTAHDAGDTAICLVSDGYVEYGTEPPALRPPTESRIIVILASTGRVVATRPAPGATSFVVLPDLVVTASATGDGGLQVVATDPLTGAVRWRHARPPAPVTSHGAVFAAGEEVGIWMPPGMVTLLDRDGAVLRSDVDARTGYAVDPSTGEVTVSTNTSGSAVSSDLHAPVDVTYPGLRVAIGVDDGSVPRLVLTYGQVVESFDRDTGEHRWTLDRRSYGKALVVLGRIYLMTSSGVVAVDGSSGEILWQSSVPTGAILRNLFTDGRHVLASIRHDRTTELVAFELDDGAKAWHTTLPDGIDSVSPIGHLLIGFDSGAPSVLG